MEKRCFFCNKPFTPDDDPDFCSSCMNYLAPEVRETYRSVILESLYAPKPATKKVSGWGYILLITVVLSIAAIFDAKAGSRAPPDITPLPVAATATPQPTPRPTPVPSPAPNGYITGGSVNFRLGPGTDYTIRGQLKYGTEVRLLGVVGPWWHVTVDGASGYIHENYISLDPPSPARQTTKPDRSTTRASPATPRPTEKPTPKPTPIPAPERSGQTVYITKTGEKYHNSGCKHLSRSKIPIDLNEARRRGYDACKVCH